MTRYMYLIMLLALIGCSDEEAYESNGEHRPIYLAVALDKVTRAPYELQNPTTNKPLDVDVWASTTKYEYPNNGKNGSESDGTVELHTTAHFQSSAPQLLSNAIYNKDAQKQVYFISMYPQGWDALYGNTQADFTFNGAQDVMFASQISGTYATEYEKTPQFCFRHLLTWLTFELKADTEDAATAWGKIQKIEIRSRKAVSIDLSAKSYTESPSDDGKTLFEYNWNGDGIKYADEDQLPLYHVKPQSEFLTADTTFEDKYSAKGGYELDYTRAHEVAYVMCAPVVGSYTDADDEPTDEYVLTIVTEKRTIEIGLDLKKAAGTAVDSYYVGSTRGRKFSFLLNFRLGNTITVSGQMNDWEPGGIINKDIRE